MVRRKITMIIALLLLLGGGGWSRADTFHFQQGAADPCHPEFGIYLGGHDVTITQDTVWLGFNPDKLRMKYQSGAEKFNTLIRFEGIEEQLQGKVITSAYITLTWRSQDKDWLTPIVDIHPLNKPWADPNATWVFADSGFNIRWDLPGAAHDPNDRGPLSSRKDDFPIRSFAVGNYTDGDTFDFELDPNLVQKWINESGSNYGVIMIMNHDIPSDLTFSSSEYSTVGDRPLLIITAIECSEVYEADINKDCYVDGQDYAIFANQWLEAPGIPSADIAPPGGDNIVNFLDLQVFVSQWLKCSDPTNNDCSWQP